MLKGEIFSTEMVRAWVDRRKVHTARPIPNDAEIHIHGNEVMVTRPKKFADEHCRFHPLEPKHRPGDYIYFRETWGDYDGQASYYTYKADYPDGAKTYEWPEPDEFGEKIICDLPKWKPSIHMPKGAARHFAKVTRVEVISIDDVTEQFAVEDGFINDDKLYGMGNPPLGEKKNETALMKFVDFWQQTYGETKWMWVYWLEPCSKEEAYGGAG